MLRMDGLRAVEVLQQREFVRGAVGGARARLHTCRPVEVQSFTIDVSGGGLLLAGPETLRIGERDQVPADGRAGR